MLEDLSFWAAVGLLIFVGIMLYFGAPKLRRPAILDKRAETIRNELDEARRLPREAQAVLAEYQRKAREAEHEAEEIVEQARREAAAYAAEAIGATDEYVARRTKIAEQKIDLGREPLRCRRSVALSTDVAIAAAERILRSKVAGTEAERLVTGAIDEVKARLH